VLKPGGHLLAFAGTRTYDLMGISIRMAGFEIRDSIGWVYGSGFPKSLDVSKAIDKAAGAEREVIGTKPQAPKFNLSDKGGNNTGYNKRLEEGALPEFNITAPSTPDAKQWQGWGTALKPALEPIVVARKPLDEKTVAANVLTHGTGGLNIDASRIGTEQRTNQPAGNKQDSKGVYKFSNDEVDAFNGTEATTVQGRWPANLILDEYTAELLDEQSGQTGGGKMQIGAKARTNIGHKLSDTSADRSNALVNYGDTGGASRFFYVAKASKRDRNEGLEDLEDSQTLYASGSNLHNNGDGTPRNKEATVKNFHPTVKPTELMRYLVKLITPPDGTVLDPFTGSGSTGKAAILEGFDFIGIELTEDYWPIIEGRLKYAEAKVAEAKENQEAQPEGLF
jgi:site-specific DNA-methyltransferase (adenine-specific)